MLLYNKPNTQGRGIISGLSSLKPIRFTSQPSQPRDGGNNKLWYRVYGHMQDPALHAWDDVDVVALRLDGWSVVGLVQIT